MKKPMKARVGGNFCPCTEICLYAPRVEWEWGSSWAQCCEHLFALPQFFVLLLIILLAEVTLAILLFVYEQKVSYKKHNSLLDC